MAERRERFAFARRVLVAALVVLAVFGVAFLVWTSARVLLLAFGGVLVGVLLDGLAGALARTTRLSRRVALGLVGLGGVAFFVGLGFLLGPQLVTQAGELGGSLSGGLEALKEQLSGIPGAEPVLEELTTLQQSGSELASRLAGAFSTFIGGLTNVLVILVIGVYLASNPKLYQRGLLHLVPKRNRARGTEILEALGRALRGWLLGQFISMIVVSALATAGFLLLGVPLALALGALTFLLAFVPYIGAIAAFVPAILVALTQSPTLALWTAGLYLVVQFVETYLVSPLVMQRVVSLPPAVLLFSQVLLGALGGILGVALAAPLGVAIIVLVQTLYVEDVLGDKVEVLGEASDDSGP
jgi:predicted PurR-regulated permease PerM